MRILFVGATFDKSSLSSAANCLTDYEMSEDRLQIVNVVGDRLKLGLTLLKRLIIYRDVLVTPALVNGCKLNII